MGHNRFKGIECDQCGIPCSTALHLVMSVRTRQTTHIKEKHVVNDAEFYADFCSKECMQKFLNRYYFESGMEVIEDV